MNEPSPLTRKDGQTPDRDLSNYKSPQREVRQVPTGIPGWIAVPQWPVPREKNNEQ